MILITPPFASDPYNVDAEPFNTSIRSTLSRFFSITADILLLTLFIFTPSTRTTISSAPLIFKLLLLS